MISYLFGSVSQFNMFNFVSKFWWFPLLQERNQTVVDDFGLVTRIIKHVLVSYVKKRWIIKLWKTNWVNWTEILNQIKKKFLLWKYQIYKVHIDRVIVRPFLWTPSRTPFQREFPETTSTTVTRRKQSVGRFALKSSKCVQILQLFQQNQLW